MDLSGVRVKHKTLGEGVIKQPVFTKNGKEYIFVIFSKKEMKFHFPDAFEKYLSVLDHDIASKISIEIQKNEQHESAKPKTKWDDCAPKAKTLSSIKSDHEARIRGLIEKRQINHLIHFTRIENLQSILQNGLIPVCLQQKLNIPSIHNDRLRKDSKTDCTSCSVEFPNFKLFYKFREYDFPGTRWVVVVLDKEVLFSLSNIAFYCYTNAAKVMNMIMGDEEKELCSSTAFTSMFRGCAKSIGNKEIYRDLLQINDCLTTDPQAEVLIKGIIEPKYISGVYFYDEQDIEHYLMKNGSDALSRYPHKIMPSFFGVREDYKFW